MSVVKEQDVVDAITSIEFTKMGKKTMVGIATLKNGYEIVESSSCVDPQKFNVGIGKELVKERIHHKVWELLGFKAQDAQPTTQTKVETKVETDDDAFDGDE